MDNDLEHYDRVYAGSDIQVITAIAFIKLQQIKQSQESEDVISRADEPIESTTIRGQED